jgi:hypothetical protein
MAVCGYSNGVRTCKTAATPGSTFCKLHTCSENDCQNSKSSREAVCPSCTVKKDEGEQFAGFGVDEPEVVTRCASCSAKIAVCVCNEKRGGNTCRYSSGCSTATAPDSVRGGRLPFSCKSSADQCQPQLSSHNSPLKSFCAQQLIQTLNFLPDTIVTLSAPSPDNPEPAALGSLLGASPRLAASVHDVRAQLHETSSQRKREKSDFSFWRACALHSSQLRLFRNTQQP